MRRAVQESIIDRLLAQVETGTLQMADDETRVPVSHYTSAAHLAEEQRVLFRGHPIIVGHASAIPAPGDFLTHDASGAPLLVVRGADGIARAFLNACRHRGSRVAVTERGHCKAFVCRYHAWTYDTRGDLVHVPQPQSFPLLDRATSGLVPVALAERHGFLWVVVSGGGGGGGGLPDLASSLGTFDDDLDSFALAGHVAHRRVALRRRCNWKLVVDAFLEGYHVKSLHRGTIYRFFHEACTVFDAEGPHTRSAGARRTLDEARGASRDTWDVRHYATVFYFLFPNTILVFHPDWVSRLTLFPDGTDACFYEHEMLIPRPPASDADAAHWDKTFSLIEDQVFQTEDLAIAESIQSTLASGADDHFRIGRLEYPITHFHRAIDAAITAAPAAPR